jgi:hypothetical protein
MVVLGYKEHGKIQNPASTQVCQAVSLARMAELELG